jgi:hypothetical protein
MMRNGWLAAAAALGLGACQSHMEPGAPPVEDPPGAPSTLVVGPARDVAPAAAPELAFREDAGGFRAGYLTHGVTIREGIIDLVPKHFDLETRRLVTGGAIGLQTTGVFAGGVRIDDGAGLQARQAPNVVNISRGVVTEEITNRDDGIEQAWRFAARPPGMGDLIVEVGVAGQTFVAATESGLHFRSPAGLGVRYSHAVWRDAAGAELDLAARYEDGRILIAVPQDVVQTAAYPAILDPTIGAELFTDTPANGTTGANSRNQDVAAGDTGYLVVWQDQRDDRSDDIFATRIGADGAILDATGIRVNAASGVQQNPAVTYVGTGYLVAWEHVVSTGNADIAAAFVANDGTVTQLGTIAGTMANETGPAVAGRGGEALLAWSDGTAVRGALFGLGLFGPAFDVAAGTTPKREAAVSANPAGNYLVTFTETIATSNDDIRGQLVTPLGATSGAAFTIAGGAGLQTQSAAAFDGTNHIVAWTSVSNVLAARVSAAGAVLDTTPVTINASTNAQILPDLGCTAAGCVIVWQDSRNAMTSVRDVFGAVVTPALAITTNDIAIAGATRAQDTPAIAVNGTGQYYATWADNRDLEYTYVRGARMTSAGMVQDADGVILATAISRHQAPAVVQAGSTTDVVMAETQSPDVNLVHARFGASGAQTDNPPKLVSNATGAQVTPAVAIVGGSSLVVWGDTRGADRDIYAARINLATGATLDAMGIPVSTATADQFVPKIASSGDTALVVWQDRRNGAANGFDIYAAVIDGTGTVTVNDIAICTGAGDQGGPAVAYDATNGVYLVVWTDPSGASVDIRGARVSTAGALVDANCGAPITTASGTQAGADVAFGGGRFLVVWEDRRNDPALNDIYGSRVTASGGALTVQDPSGLPISQVVGSAQSAPSVAFGTTNTGFLVAWTDARNAATTGTDIWGVQLNGITAALGLAFAISAGEGDEGSVDVSPGPSATPFPFNVAYSKRNVALGTVRMQLRRVGLSTAGGSTCTSGTQCESGFCVDGRCCDTACGGNTTTDCQACSVARGAVADGTCTIIAATLHYICRDYAVRTDTPQCDVREYCDGASTACPADLGQNAGAACTKMNGTTGTCPAADATGAPHSCQP